MSPSIRTSRTIRSRLAKRGEQRIAKRITIDRRGLIIDGHRFQPHIGAEIEIDHLMQGELALVTVGIYAETVEQSGPLPRHAQITQRFH